MKTMIITMILLVAIVTPGHAKKIKNAPRVEITVNSVAPRMEAQLNSKSVNPIVISRDRALGN